MSQSISRRRALSTIASAAAIVPAAALPALAAGDDDPGHALWESRAAVKQARRLNEVEWNIANTEVPAWARGGPEYMNYLGERVDDAGLTREEGGTGWGWPEIENPTPPENPNVLRRIRPSEATIKAAIKEGREDDPDALRRFHARIAERDALLEKLGVAELERAGDVLYDAYSETETAIFQAAQTKPTAATAAAALITGFACDNEGDWFDSAYPQAVSAALRFLRPMLIEGTRLAQDVDSFLDGIAADQLDEEEEEEETA